eukprot:scaffold98510_cov63-Phaeocystis_antarctica.AAC.1
MPGHRACKSRRRSGSVSGPCRILQVLPSTSGTLYPQSRLQALLAWQILKGGVASVKTCASEWVALRMSASRNVLPPSVTGGGIGTGRPSRGRRRPP